MKRLKDHTNNELLKLTEEAIWNLIDLECAHEGVPLLPPDPGPAPEFSLPTPDVEFYSVGDFHFAKMSEATKVLDILQKSSLINKNNRWNPDYVVVCPMKINDYSTPRQVTVEKGYSKELAATFVDSTKEFQKTQKEWRETKEKYDKIKKQRQEIVDKIMNEIQEARDVERARQEARNQYDRYLSLAENDEAIAKRFFRDANEDGYLLLFAA